MTVPGGKPTGTLARRGRELSRRLFRRWLWSVGYQWREVASNRTTGSDPEIVVDPSSSRRDHRAKYGCLLARPRVRRLCPPWKTQHLLSKSVFDRPGSDRWNLASTTFPDAGPMVRIRFPPPASLDGEPEYGLPRRVVIDIAKFAPRLE